MQVNKEKGEIIAHQEKYWSKLASTYGKDQEYIVGKTILQLIIQRLSKEYDLGDVIEFGCGTGYFTQVIAENARHVITTDLSDEMLEKAKITLREFQNVTIQKANCEDTSFPSGRFDTVFMANLIHVVANPIKTLQESHQILRDGGLLLIIDFTSYNMNWFEKTKLTIRYLMKWGMPPRHAQNNLSPEKIISFVENVDFIVEEVQTVGDKVKALYLRAKK